MDGFWAKNGSELIAKIEPVTNCPPQRARIAKQDGIIGPEEAQTIGYKINIFPIPSNNSVSVQYSLGKEDMVSITISDLSGKYTKQLLNNKPHKPGEYSFRFDTRGLEQGIYLFSVVRGNQLEVKRIVIQ